MKVLNYRTIAVSYPFMSLEAMVELDKGVIVYPSIAVENGRVFERIDDIHNDNVFTHPMTDIDWSEPDCYGALLPSGQYEQVIEMLMELWNENPVFDNDFAWKVPGKEKKNPEEKKSELDKLINADSYLENFYNRFCDVKKCTRTQKASCCIFISLREEPEVFCDPEEETADVSVKAGD